MGRLDGRVAIVTGGGRGIGRATAQRLAQEGAAVVINDIDADPAHEVAELLGKAGSATAVVGSTSDPDLAERLVQTAVSEFGGVDILINNAGTTRDKMFHNLDPAAFELVIDANLRTSFHATQAAVRHMRATAKQEIAETGSPRYNRKIVFTSSVAALTGNPGQFNYTAAKGAVIAAAKTLARELGPFGINVNAVAPGFIDTRLTAPKEDGGDLGIPEQMRQLAIGMIALGRAGTPEDIAAVHAFLASPDSDFISGVTIPVTGGQYGGMG